jgi:Uma2 family endonuclease
MTSMPAPTERVPRDHVTVQYAVPRTRPDWTLEEELLPESQPHDLTLDLLKAILVEWVSRSGRAAHVTRNLAVRWERSQPKIGTDPDLSVLEPAPPDADELDSLCTWQPNHPPPRLSIEVVSSHARKDYVAAPEKCAAAGIDELWVFDPHLAGPRLGGGPHRLQLWRRLPHGFTRVYAGDGPVYSPYLDAWVFAVNEGRRVRIADDEAGSRWWLTAEERERAERERERAEKERERAERERERAERERERAEAEQLRARIAELEARLAKG